MAMIARAISPECKRVRNQKSALRLAKAEPALLDVRADHRANLIAWYEIHARWASWGGEGRSPAGVTEPTRARVCELAGFGESTYKACRRWWEARGYIAVVRPGSTPDLMPGVLRTAEDHNIRQAYVLCAPRRPRVVPCEKNQPPPAQDPSSSLTRPLSSPRSGLDRFPARPCASGGGKPAGANPGTGGAPRAAQLRGGPLRLLTDGWWIHLTAAFAAAGYTAADMVFAVNHLPAGRAHKHTLATTRHPAGWLRWRLSHWLAGDGTPLPPPSAQRAAALDASRQEQAARRAEYAAIAAARSADNAGRAAAARQMLITRPRPEPLRAAERPAPPRPRHPYPAHQAAAGSPAAGRTAPPSPPAGGP